MIRNLTSSLAAVAVCLSILASAPASAQSPTARTWQGWNYQMMEDLTQEMASMTEQMSRGEFTPDQRLQMAQRMGRMSMMMRRMSSLAALPTMKEADQKKKMQQMRRQMDEMIRNSHMTPHG